MSDNTQSSSQEAAPNIFSDGETPQDQTPVNPPVDTPVNSPDNQHSPWSKLKDRLSRHKLILIIVCIVVAVFVSAWIVYSIFFSQITVGTTSVKARTSDQKLTELFEKQAHAYKLTFVYPDGKKQQFTLKDLGTSIDIQRSIAAAHEQQQFSKRLIWWQHKNVAAAVKTDNATLNSFIAANSTVIAQPSQDAVLSLKDGEIVISEAITGKQYGLANPQKVILSSVSSLRSQTLKLKTLAVNPAITTHELQPYKNTLEKTLSQPITFIIGIKKVTATSTDIANWLEITPQKETKKLDIAVNSGKVQEYINKITSSEIYPARAQVMINQPDGTQRVLVAGVSGVDVTNKSAAATSIAKSLLNNSGINTTLTIRNDPFKTITAGLYDKWIEVDITNKRMYAYEKDSLVKTELISAGAPGTPTVTGQYAIYSKFPQQDMRGRNVDGSNYFQPHVRWVSYFYKDYAIHGNYWRPLSYFGNINSSHGCVGVVDNDAAWIYNWAPIGTPVIVHD